LGDLTFEVHYPHCRTPPPLSRYCGTSAARFRHRYSFVQYLSMYHSCPLPARNARFSSAYRHTSPVRQGLRRQGLRTTGVRSLSGLHRYDALVANIVNHFLNHHAYLIPIILFGGPLVGML